MADGLGIAGPAKKCRWSRSSDQDPAVCHARSTNNGRKIQESSWPNSLVSDDEDLPPLRSMERVAKLMAKFSSPLPMIGPYIIAEDDVLPPPRAMNEAK